jgi:hypothetical protein
MQASVQRWQQQAGITSHTEAMHAASVSAATPQLAESGPPVWHKVWLH